MLQSSRTTVGTARTVGWASIGALLLLAAVLGLATGCGSSSSAATTPTTPGGGGGGGGGGGTGPLYPGSGAGGDDFLTVDKVWIGDDRVPVVEFTLTDPTGHALLLGDLDSDPRWILSYIEVDATNGLSRYQCYFLRTVNGQAFNDGGMMTPPALPNAMQATTDSGGTMEDLGNGSYRYTFGNTLPAAFPLGAAHTLAGYATMSGRTIVANPVVHFVPDGSALGELREIVDESSCNECHSTLSAHGGSRRRVGLCIVCHTDQTTDPESGNTVEFKVMIHKIHKGADLANHPYRIIGFGGSIHDWSENELPQDVRNCTKCHRGGAQEDNWKLHPSRAACGACHDHIDFTVTDSNDPAYHPGQAQANDNLCHQCHQETMASEFDRTIPGAHVIPYKSSANPQLTLAITNVVNMSPNSSPTLTFTISDKNGPVDINTVDRVAVVFGGPTTDYTTLINSNHRFTMFGGGSTGVLTPMGVGTYQWNAAPYVIPMGSSGTWAVGLESRTANIPVNGQNIRFGANNPVVYVDLAAGTLGAGSPVPRRMVVDEATRCASCHDDLILHGNLRTNIQYCVMCHNRWTTDEERRPGVLHPVDNPPESIDFTYMIHKIHKGVELENGYVVYGFNSSVHDFGAHVHFPGILENCSQCHLPNTNQLPLGGAGRAAQVFNIAGVPLGTPFSIRPPATAACTACHDGADVMAHAQLNTLPNNVTDPNVWAEACSVCHGQGALFEPHK